MAETPKIPIVAEKPSKPISKMTKAERDAFARRIFNKMAASRKPANDESRGKQ